MAGNPSENNTELSNPAGPDLAASPDHIVDLPSGEGLSYQSTDSVTRKRLTHVILFAGTAESGKTTLLATIYLMFRKAPFAGFNFAGSSTLVGFEKRVHDATITSGRSSPKTERSVVSELLHLSVRPVGNHSGFQDVLFCDMVGEDFREARDSTDYCRSLQVLRRADSIVLLVDGDKLSRLDSRQQAKSDPVYLMQNCLDSTMLSPRASVDVLFTKWDLVEASRDRETILSFAEHVEHTMRSKFSSRVGDLSFSRVAAQPQSGSLPLGHGIEPLFRKWLERPVGASRFQLSPLSLHDNAPEYDRFMRRTLPDEIGGVT